MMETEDGSQELEEVDDQLVVKEHKEHDHKNCQGHGHGHNHEKKHGHSHGGKTCSGHGNDSKEEEEEDVDEGMEGGHDENMYGVFLHVLADTLGSVGAVAAVPPSDAAACQRIP